MGTLGYLHFYLLQSNQIRFTMGTSKDLAMEFVVVGEFGDPALARNDHDVIPDSVVVLARIHRHTSNPDRNWVWVFGDRDSIWGAHLDTTFRTILPMTDYTNLLRNLDSITPPIADLKAKIPTGVIFRRIIRGMLEPTLATA